MTTIAEQSGQLSDIIDTLATELATFAEWDDTVAPGVVNDGSTDNYEDNGRTLLHNPTSTYVTMFVGGSNFQAQDSNGGRGILFVFSDGWNTTHSKPDGRTSMTSEYSEIYTELRPEDSTEETDLNQTYRDNIYETDQVYNDTPSFMSIAITGEHTSASRSTARTTDVNFFGTARTDTFTVGAWNNTFSDSGMPTAFVFEEVTKFYNDGLDTHMAWNASLTPDNNEHHQQYNYGYQVASGESSPSLASPDVVGNNLQGIGQSEWGFLNSEPSDDTFFFRRPAFYKRRDERIPVGFGPRQVLPNDNDDGVGHGDTVTVQNVNDQYRCFRKTGAGASGSEPISFLLRYE